MQLQERIKAAAIPLAEGRRVADVRIGLGYTAVLLDSGSAGLAYTFLDEAGGGCSVYRNIRPLAGRPAEDLLRLFTAGGRIEAALALATANALFNRPERTHRPGDILQHLRNRSRRQRGHGGPFWPIGADHPETGGRVAYFRTDRTAPGRPAARGGGGRPCCLAAR